jgi:hypothetical protein
MWAAVGEPDKKPRWEHLGIVKAFIRGTWFVPQAGNRSPGVLEEYRFALRRLYDLRLRADYRLDDVSQQDAQWAIRIVQEIITLSEQKGVDDATTTEEI